ncbi:STAS domain-containing protein [Streptomyces sp. SLBN-31]|uniref:STAS domain-containing protein n=1 Tax=Streptomyces sp. SLBN-31 TaxID=2768444 RepID=UPI0011703218|nr:STAS domain-containing protein [Streptomyces sp. SLBN-31]TQJ92174.1 anti-anti-sigma factor [Streptomyces sp. SLBN-31]
MTPVQLTLAPERTADGTALLTVTGEIDMSNSGRLADALDRLPGHVVLDLTGVDYLDSAGLNVLFARAERIEVIADTLLRPLLTVSGLADLVPVRPAPGR